MGSIPHEPVIVGDRAERPRPVEAAECTSGDPERLKRPSFVVIDEVLQLRRAGSWDKVLLWRDSLPMLFAHPAGIIVLTPSGKVSR